MKGLWARFRVRWRQVLLLALLALLVSLALSGRWPFWAPSQRITTTGDLLAFLLNDRTVIGVVRLVLIILGFYVVLSILSQAARDRWISALSSKGMEIDKVVKGAEEVRQASQDIARERDDALNQVDELEEQVRGLKATVESQERLIRKLADL